LGPPPRREFRADRTLLVAGSSSKLCSVRGTVRSQDKADAWEKKHAGEFKKGQLEWSIVEDVAGKGAFDEAIKGVDIVAHTASPFVSLSAYSAVLRRPS
jgi:saccharopine dehydrogenase-like NADP-dependent oxidoreductase